MGSEKDEKDMTKLEKKRLKAQYKAEKARVKAGQVTEMPDEGQVTPYQEQNVQAIVPPREPSRWYKDPNWIRAIVAIATLIILVLTLILTQI